MTKILNKSIYIFLNIISTILIVITLFLPLYEYEWMNLKERIINEDTVLIIFIFCILSLACTSVAFIIKRKSKIAFRVFLIYLIVVLGRLFSVLRLYI